MLKVLTLNMHSIVAIKDLLKTWQQRFDEIVEKLLQEKYDIICFQEVNQEIGAPVLDDESLAESGFFSANNGQIVREDNFAYQLACVLKQNGLEYNWNYNEAHIGYGKYEEGTAIFSLRKIKAAKAIISSPSVVRERWFYRIQSAMKIQGEKGIFWCISANFSWWSHSESMTECFKAEWDVFEKNVKGISDKTILVIGDFENPPQIHNQGYDYVTKDRKWYDVILNEDGSIKNYFSILDTNDRSGSYTKIGRRLDYAVSNKPIVMKDVKLVFDGKNGGIVSDHFGVEGVIDL